MFGKMMNSYYYGKSGKGDFRKDDMPETRMQLFWDTLRTRLSGLCRLNLLYMLVWLPAIIVLLLNISNLWNRLQTEMAIREYSYTEYAELLQSKEMELSITEEEYNALRSSLLERDLIYSDPNYEAYLERKGDEAGDKLTAEQFQAVKSAGASELQNSVFSCF